MPTQQNYVGSMSLTVVRQHCMGHIGPRWARQDTGAWDGGHAMAEEVKCSAVRFREGLGNIGVIINNASDVRVELPPVSWPVGDKKKLAQDQCFAWSKLPSSRKKMIMGTQLILLDQQPGGIINGICLQSNHNSMNHSHIATQRLIWMRSHILITSVNIQKQEQYQIRCTFWKNKLEMLASNKRMEQNKVCAIHITHAAMYVRPA